MIVLSRFVAVFFFSILALPALAQEETDSTSTELTKQDAITIGVEQILKIQNEDGAWPYEGVYRVNRKIPTGYRIGGTAICCEALLYATDGDNDEANQAIKRGVRLILDELETPAMQASQRNRYDVRVWGHIYALDLFCRLKASKRSLDAEIDKSIDSWIPKLTKILISEEIESGGWNYANRRAHAGFVTAPAVQALMWASQLGQDVPRFVFQRAANALARSRNSLGAFSYSGDERKRRPTKIPSSIARSTNCESTLSLLGLSRELSIKKALADFHEHWDELEKRRKKTGTHVAPYGIAPYYFYYAHRFAAQAISQLPKEFRAAEHKKLFAQLLKTRDEDGTWNDRVFARSRAYGTAMSVLALLEDKVPVPQKFQDGEQENDKDKPKTQAGIQVDLDLLDPDFTIEVFVGGKLRIAGQTVALDGLKKWIEDNLRREPSTVLISAEGNVKTGTVEQIKSIISSEFASIKKLYVGIKEDSNQ